MSTTLRPKPCRCVDPVAAEGLKLCEECGLELVDWRRASGRNAREIKLLAGRMGEMAREDRSLRDTVADLREQLQESPAEQWITTAQKAKEVGVAKHYARRHPELFGGHKPAGAPEKARWLFLAGVDQRGQP